MLLANMGRYKFYTADVFTNEIFDGNQLAVFSDAKGVPSRLMQKIAREFASNQQFINAWSYFASACPTEEIVETNE